MLSLGLFDLACADSPRQLPVLPPFLESFSRTHQVSIAVQDVRWVSAIGTHQGRLYRPDDSQRLPAVILVSDGKSTEFHARAAHDLAETRYVVVVVRRDAARSVSSEPSDKTAAHEKALAQLSAAVRWLRTRPDVFPDRIGVLGWSGGARWALELAAAQGLQACVMCGAEIPPPLRQPLAGELKHTAVMLLRAGAENTLLDNERLARFRRSLEEAGIKHRFLQFDHAKANFMDRNRHDAFDFEQADRAWFEIYEFLGKHVEDAAIQQMLAELSSASRQAKRRFASIADLMRAVNVPQAVRGQLAQSLAAESRDDKQWKLAQSRAALLAETGELLATMRPPKGDVAHWQQSAVAYRDAAAGIMTAAEAHDLSAARRSLTRLNASCGACHLEHR